MRTNENITELQKLINHDIISAINKNEAVGNISPTDASNLRDITQYLYMRIYSKYTELEDYTMKMHDESIELIGDKIEEIMELQETNQKLSNTIIELKDTNSKIAVALVEAKAENIKKRCPNRTT